MFWVILIVLLGLFSFNYRCNYFHFKWDYLLVLACTVLSYMFYEQSNAFLSILMMYGLMSSVYVGHSIAARHFAQPQGVTINANFSYSVLKCTLALMGLMVLYLFLDEKKTMDAILAIKYLTIIGSIWTVIPKKWLYFTNQLNGKSLIRGFGANTSVNATFLSLMTPFAFVNFDANLALNITTLSSGAIAIYHTGAAAGFAGFIGSAFLFFALYTGFHPYYLVTAAGGIVSILIITGRWIKIWDKGKSFWNPTGRKYIWTFTKEVVFKQSNPWFGIGIGGYHFLMPAMQKRHTEKKVQALLKRGIKVPEKDRKPPFITSWAHSDVLQLAVEGGYIGFILGILAFVSVIYTAIVTGNIAVLAFAASYLINSIANFPNHLAPDSLLTFIMLSYLFI